MTEQSYVQGVPLSQVRRVLVTKLRHHGDVLLSTPVFATLKRALPGAALDALVFSETAPLLAGHPAIGEVHVIDRGWKKQGLRARIEEEWRLLQRLREQEYDLLVHLTESSRGAWLARALGCRWSVAPRVKGRGRWWRTSFSHLYPHASNPRRHTVESNLDALRRIGIQPSEADRELVLVPGDDAGRAVQAMCAESGLEAGGYVVVHPASRWRFKCWRIEGWAEVIDGLQAAGHRVVLTCAPDDAEMALVDAICRQCATEPISLGGRLSLPELGDLIAGAKLFMGVDSVPMHMAAAMKTPCVALFGPSGDIEWGPWRVPGEVLTSNHACRPCGLDGCGGGKLSDCLQEISSDRVAAAAARILAT